MDPLPNFQRESPQAYNNLPIRLLTNLGSFRILWVSQDLSNDDCRR
jgi:hypothetical protein